MINISIKTKQLIFMPIFNQVLSIMKSITIVAFVLVVMVAITVANPIQTGEDESLGDTAERKGILPCKSTKPITFAR